MTSTAYDDFLLANQIQIHSLRQMTVSVDFRDISQVEKVTAEIRGLISNGSFPHDMTAEIEDAYKALGREIPVAVRSSSAVPQLGVSSFPGQMDTFYHVSGLEDVLKHIKFCWASLWTARAASNRWNLLPNE